MYALDRTPCDCATRPSCRSSSWCRCDGRGPLRQSAAGSCSSVACALVGRSVLVLGEGRVHVLDAVARTHPASGLVRIGLGPGAGRPRRHAPRAAASRSTMREHALGVARQQDTTSVAVGDDPARSGPPPDRPTPARTAAWRRPARRRASLQRGAGRVEARSRGARARAAVVGHARRGPERVASRRAGRRARSPRRGPPRRVPRGRSAASRRAWCRRTPSGSACRPRRSPTSPPAHLVSLPTPGTSRRECARQCTPGADGAARRSGPAPDGVPRQSRAHPGILARGREPPPARGPDWRARTRRPHHQTAEAP